MSVTIDSLDIQIRSSAGSAAANIDKLATSLGKLRENSKLTTVSNNLNRLSESLAKLEMSSSTLSSIKGLAGAMKSLAGVEKSSGLNSTLNSLKKLPEIVNALDAATLDKFAVSMRKLGASLVPLSTQLAVIGTNFSKLPPKISQMVTGVNRLSAANNKAAASTRNHSTSLNAAAINMMAYLENLQTMFHLVQTFVVQPLANVMSDAIEWDGIQFRFGRAFGEDAEEVLAYAQKVSDTLKINMQQFMQYSSLYGSLLSGFGMAQEQVTTISVGLTELSYDIWAAYNDRYKTLEDASEAVRSAITGEIEPIRNAGIALTEASMQEYLDSIGMAHISMEKLTEAQKAEVRYAVMVNAAMNQGIVGTYAREMQTAEGAVRTLSQQMKTLGQAIGSIFIPLLSAALPYISAFVELLYEGIAALAAFFDIPFFEIQWNANDGLGGIATDAAEATGSLGDAAKAAKKLKDYTMGFDELNVIDPSSSSGSGAGNSGVPGAGGSLGLDLDTLWDESVFASASKQIDELKEKIRSWLNEWKEELIIVGAALSALIGASLLTKLAEAWELGDKFIGAMKTIKKLAASAIVITLQYSLVTEFLKSYIDGDGFKEYLKALFVGAAGTAVLYSMWGPTGLVIGLSVVAAASLSAIIDNGGITNTESAVTALTGMATAAAAVGIALKKIDFTKVSAAIGAFTSTIRAFFGALKGGTAATSALAFLSPTLSKFAGFLTKAATAVSGFVTGISAPVWVTIAAVVAALTSAVYFLSKNWEEVTKAAKDFLKTNIAPKLEKIQKSWDKIKKALGGVQDAFEPVVDAVKDFFDDFDFESILSGIGKAIEVLGGIVVAVLGGTLAGVFNGVISIVSGAAQAISGIVQIVSGMVESVVRLLTGDFQGAWDAVKKTVNGIIDLFGGLWDATVGAVIEFVDGVIGWFVELWDELVGHSIVPDMINAIVEWFVNMPGRIMGAIEDFCEDIIKDFKGLWSDIKSWFNSNVAPKFTWSYWADKFDTIRSAASDKLSAVKSAITDKWESVKTWFNSDVKPKFTLTYWQGLFDTIRSSLKTKLDAAWENVKSFFSVTEWKNKATAAINSFKNSFTMPSFPKIKLEVTWDTNVDGWRKSVYEALGLKGWPNLSWKAYAAGGFPAVGEMFIAREAGPEMVGRIGSKSTVANNDQIVEGISAGVYRAVVQALGDMNGSSGQNVNVYLDGKQIYASIKRTEAERGVSIMGNQLGYAY